MEAMYIILGALLALGGGVITHHIQLHYSQLKEESQLLLEIEKSLLELNAIEKEIAKISDDTEDIKQLAERHSLKHDMLSHLEKLHLFSIRIFSNKNRSIDVRVTKYAIDDHLRTEENRFILLREVQMALNEKLITQYENETNKDPSAF